MARAFRQDPLIQQLFPEPRTHEQLQRFYALQLRALRRAGVMVVARQDHRVQAVFSFLPPGQQVTLWDELWAGEAAMLPLLGRRLPAALEVQQLAAQLRAQHAPQAWYAALIAVDPSAQGQGWLRRGLEPLLHHARATGEGFYLETQNPVNVTIYGRLGLRPLPAVHLTGLTGLQHYPLSLGSLRPE